MQLRLQLPIRRRQKPLTTELVYPHPLSLANKKVHVTGMIVLHYHKRILNTVLVIFIVISKQYYPILAQSIFSCSMSLILIAVSPASPLSCDVQAVSALIRRCLHTILKRPATNKPVVSSCVFRLLCAVVYNGESLTLPGKCVMQIPKGM
jgi:hypothetical protein